MKKSIIFCLGITVAILISCSSTKDSSKSSENNQLSKQEKKEGYLLLFNGKTIDDWTGDTKGYIVDDGTIAIHPELGKGGNLFTKKEYSDFDFRFEFQLTPGANNGVGIRAPLEGDAAYVGMELQILDDGADIYKDLHPYQYHGSIYGVVPAKRGFLKPVGQWNYEEVIAKGPKIRSDFKRYGDYRRRYYSGTGKWYVGWKSPSGFEKRQWPYWFSGTWLYRTF